MVLFPGRHAFSGPTGLEYYNGCNDEGENCTGVPLSPGIAEFMHLWQASRRLVPHATRARRVRQMWQSAPLIT